MTLLVYYNLKSEKKEEKKYILIKPPDVQSNTSFRNHIKFAIHTQQFYTFHYLVFWLWPTQTLTEIKLKDVPILRDMWHRANYEVHQKEKTDTYSYKGQCWTYVITVAQFPTSYCLLYE
jgi:hypothetical protein